MIWATEETAASKQSRREGTGGKEAQALDIQRGNILNELKRVVLFSHQSNCWKMETSFTISRTSWWMLEGVIEVTPYESRDEYLYMTTTTTTPRQSVNYSVVLSSSSSFISFDHSVVVIVVVIFKGQTV